MSILQKADTDPLTTTIAGDRLDAASLVRDEKWATESVFSGMMQVNIISDPLPLTQGEAITPPGTLLEVYANDVLTEHFDEIVLVENGIVARYWHQCCIPDKLSRALMVYRGHGAETVRTVRNWIEQLPPHDQEDRIFRF